jgi:hypothetical protein
MAAGSQGNAETPDAQRRHWSIGTGSFAPRSDQLPVGCRPTAALLPHADGLEGVRRFVKPLVAHNPAVAERP